MQGFKPINVFNRICGLDEACINCVFGHISRRGIRGTQVEPSIQDILDEVAPIKEAPLWG